MESLIMFFLFSSFEIKVLLMNKKSSSQCEFIVSKF